MDRIARGLGLAVDDFLPSPGPGDVFRQAGLSHVVVGGGAAGVGRVLLGFLGPR